MHILPIIILFQSILVSLVSEAYTYDIHVHCTVLAHTCIMFSIYCCSQVLYNSITVTRSMFQFGNVSIYSIKRFIICDHMINTNVTISVVRTLNNELRYRSLIQGYEQYV